MTKKPHFRENITTRYGTHEKVTYDAVMALARKMDISISRAQIILVRRGLGMGGIKIPRMDVAKEVKWNDNKN